MDVQVSIPPPPPPPPQPFFTETTAPAPPPVTTTNVASPPTQDRIWLHPWTVTEMRENASQWSLAGDAGLLLHLEQFSDKLVQRADAIQQHLNQTINAVKSTHTRVENCLNEFTSLANTQFIENRVYDEDETASVASSSKKDEQSTDKTNVSNTEAQEKVLQRYVEAIQYGLSILDTHFERVEAKLDNIPNGNSLSIDDDDDAGVAIEPLLEPKDPYIFRPLPHLIGTTEFMQDDYVGLGDLVNKEDPDNVEPIEVETDLASSSSDQEDEDIKVETPSAPIVPAGASRPDLANRQPPQTETSLTDNEDEDDPFGLNAGPKFDDFSRTQPIVTDNVFDEPKIPTKPKQEDFTLDKGSDNEENDLFGIPIKKPPTIIDDKNDNSDNESSTSKESEESKHMPGISMLGGAQKGMSELEKAVLRRRKVMGDPDLPADNEEDSESNETISSIVIKKKPKPKSHEPSSNTISNLTSQPLTTPEKFSKSPSIFGEHDDNDDDIFSDISKSKPLPTTKIDTKSPLIIPQKKENDIFDNDTDDEDDPFKSKKKESIPIKKTDPSPKSQPTVINKPTRIIQSDESDEDNLFGAKKEPPKPTPTVSSTPVIKKPKSPSSDDDELFTTPPITKLQPPPTTTSTRKGSEDEDPLFIGKPPVQQPTTPVVPPPAPVTIPSVKKRPSTTDEDSESELFGITQTKSKVPVTEPQKVVSPTKSDNEDDLFGKSTIKPNLLTTEKGKVIPPVQSNDNDKLLSTPTNKPKAQTTAASTKSDDDEELFPPNPLQVKLPPPVTPSPLARTPTIKTDVFEDPLLGIRKSVETTPQPPIKTPSVPIVQPMKKHLSDSDDEEPSPKRELNKAALKEGEKPSVKALSSLLNINPNAHKPGTRPKSHSITEEQPKSSVHDEQPIQNVEPPPPSIGKKLSTLDSDSDDELFNNKKKETPTTPIIESKDKTNIENENKKVDVKTLSSLIKIHPMKPGAHPTHISNEENESNNTTQTTSNETSKHEPTVDKTMLNILKDRAKVSVKTRTPPTRKPRSTGIAAAASTNENDDLFALPTSTNTSSPPASAIVPVTPLPTAVPIIPPPTAVSPLVPVTGLPANSAAIAAMSNKQTNSKEKKKFSLFDSDDSDIDELLFGSNKKNKSPAVSQPTITPSATSKTTTKSSALSVDDNDNDFLSKRPIKKSTKPVEDDDDDKDFLSKRPTKKSTKPVEDDDNDKDFLSKRPTKKSTKPVEDDDDDKDFLSKRPIKKGTKPVDNDDIFADVKTKTQQTNKAKKDWSIMNKTVTDNTDDIFNDTTTKSSATPKPKPTNVKNKSIKDLDDIFDDPLNVSSKQ